MLHVDHWFSRNSLLRYNALLALRKSILVSTPNSKTITMNKGFINVFLDYYRFKCVLDLNACDLYRIHTE